MTMRRGCLDRLGEHLAIFIPIDTRQSCSYVVSIHCAPSFSHVLLSISVQEHIELYVLACFGTKEQAIDVGIVPTWYAGGLDSSLQ